jgi:two-component system OmpR family response regulator
MKTLRPFLIHMIDDDELFLRALQHHLQENLRETVSVKWFLTGEEFLKQMPESKPDLVILDHILNSKLPFAMDGRSVLQKIRQTDPRVPVIMLSGQNKIEVALDTIKNGANDYIVKNDNAFLKIMNIVKHAIKESFASQKRKFYAGWAAMVVSGICIVSLGIMIFNLLFSK